MPAPRNTIPVPEIATAFPDLNERKFRLLGFCAYHGSLRNKVWTLTQYEGKFNLPRNRTVADLRELEEAGYLDQCEVCPADYFRILVPLIRHFPEWVRDFEELGRYATDARVYLRKVAKSLADGNLRNAALLRFPAKSNSLWKYFMPLALEGDERENVLSILPQNIADSVLEGILQEQMEAETLTDELSDKIHGLAVAWLDNPRPVLDRLGAYRYYRTGVLPEETTGAESAWTLGVRAVGALIRGDLTGAMDGFSRGAQCLPADCDGAFPDRILTWFHALCLACNRRKYRSERSRKALTQLVGSNGFRYNTAHSPTWTLLVHMEDTDKKCPDHVRDELREFLSKDRTAVGRHFALLLAKYFRLGEDVCADLGLTDAAISPTMRGSARLCLRIAPLPNDLQGYRMEMSAAPCVRPRQNFSGGDGAVAPGYPFSTRGFRPAR